MVVIGKNSHNELSVAAAEQKKLGPFDYNLKQFFVIKTNWILLYYRQ